MSTKKDGTDRLNDTVFSEALLEAKVISFADGGANGAAKGGPNLSFDTKLLFNGNLLVGKAYTAQLGPQLGDGGCFRGPGLWRCR